MMHEVIKNPVLAKIEYDDESNQGEAEEKVYKERSQHFWGHFEILLCFPMNRENKIWKFEK